MSVNNCIDSLLQAATPENHFKIELNENLTDYFFDAIPTTLILQQLYNLQSLNLQ